MNNKKDGNAFEREFCTLLGEMGFWVHNMAQTQAGQPADVLAVFAKRAFLIDCKLCPEKGFALSRIEPNQDTAMDFWYRSGNGVGWFALKCKDEITMVSKFTMDNLRRMGKAVLNPQEIRDYGTNLELWRTMVAW